MSEDHLVTGRPLFLTLAFRAFFDSYIIVLSHPLFATLELTLLLGYMDKVLAYQFM